MDIKRYIKQQKLTKDTDKTKILLLKSVSELLLFPDNKNYTDTIKYLSVLANTFYIELKSVRIEKPNNINKALLYKVSEVIQNKYGYIELLPETFELVLSFAKNNNLKLSF